MSSLGEQTDHPLFSFETRELENGEVLCRIFQDGQVVSYLLFLNLLVESDGFRTFFTKLLMGLFGSSKAYLWECIPVTSDSLETPFMFVIEESKGLKRTPCDRLSFKEHFTKSENEFVNSFSNLGGDAHLVTPLPRKNFDYTHIAAFLNLAPDVQKSEFWKCVGLKMKEGLTAGNRTLWLSTNGLGVGWLHVRIDERPKYYRFQEFRKYPAAYGKLWSVYAKKGLVDL